MNSSLLTIQRFNVLRYPNQHGPQHFHLDKILFHILYNRSDFIEYNFMVILFSTTPGSFSLSFMAYDGLDVKIRSQQLPGVAGHSIDISSWAPLSFSQVGLRVTQNADHVIMLSDF
jgi:hypothetical protein